MSYIDKLLQKRIYGVIVSVFIIFAMFASNSHAGINISFGISTGDIIRTLQGKGYSQIQVHDKGFKTGKAYACKDGIKYNVKVDIKGRIKSTSKVGNCRNQVTEKQVQRNLEANGFTRIVIDEQNNNYIVIGCKGQQRTRLIISQQGELLKRRNIGECRAEFAPSDIRKVLRTKGYNRIQFTDRQLPWYVAEACLKNQQVELTLTRFGEIRKERKIGRCNSPIQARNLTKVMREKGYDRISIINAKSPRYRVEACAQNTRFDITLNRYGKITQRTRIGDCALKIDRGQITQILLQEGFSRIRVRQGQAGNYRIIACFEGYEKRIKLNKYGELLEEVDGEKCTIQSFRQIRKSLQDNGFSKTKFYAESCKNGKKIRITLNQFGDRVSRQRVGDC